MWLPWLQFAACAAVIAFAGVRLSRYGDAIAAKTGATRIWVGLVLLATVTSLPELVTGLSAVGLADLPDIAVGDVLGSCVFNLLLLMVVDFLHRRESVYTRASIGHILSAGFGIVLIGLVTFGVFTGQLRPGFGETRVGAYTPIILALYAIAIRAVFRYESAHAAEYAESSADEMPHLTLRQAVMRYAAWSTLVVGAGIWLPFVGERIAVAMSWERSFVGNLFVAFATSLPEVVVTAAAVRAGALDLAIGNLFGSNLFNILIIAIDDLVYARGPLLTHVSRNHAVSGITAIMMTGVAIVALVYRPRSQVFRAVGWTSLLLLVLYLVNAYVLYLYQQ